MNLRATLMDVLMGADGRCLDTEEERGRVADQVLAWAHAELPTPAYVHDCDHCVFVGQVTDSRGELHDVYEHRHTSTDEQRVFGSSIIARFGSDGPEYASMDEQILKRALSPESVLQRAYDLVKARRDLRPPEVFQAAPDGR